MSVGDPSLRIIELDKSIACASCLPGASMLLHLHSGACALKSPVIKYGVLICCMMLSQVSHGILCFGIPYRETIVILR
jgi:hypothetical protein